MTESKPARLSIDERADEGLLVLHGDVDSHTAGMLESSLAALEATDEIALDLSDVAFIDSSGLRVVIACHQARSDDGRRLVLRSPSDVVTRLLEITGVHEHLHVE